MNKAVGKRKPGRKGRPSIRLRRQDDVIITRQCGRGKTRTQLSRNGLHGRRWKTTKTAQKPAHKAEDVRLHGGSVRRTRRSKNSRDGSTLCSRDPWHKAIRIRRTEEVICKRVRK